MSSSKELVLLKVCLKRPEETLIFILRAECTNLEDHITYAWASSRLVRDGAYEVIFGGEEILGPGQYRAVYFSTDARFDYKMYSKLISLFLLSASVN